MTIYRVFDTIYVLRTKKHITNLLEALGKVITHFGFENLRWEGQGSSAVE